MCQLAESVVAVVSNDSLILFNLVAVCWQSQPGAIGSDLMDINHTYIHMSWAGFRLEQESDLLSRLHVDGIICLSNHYYRFIFNVGPKPLTTTGLGANSENSVVKKTIFSAGFRIGVKMGYHYQP